MRKIKLNYTDYKIEEYVRKSDDKPVRMAKKQQKGKK
jgi:hypothetical protein